MPASSSEFVALCQAQVTLISQSLGAASSVVYVTNLTHGEETELVPVVTYPESAPMWPEAPLGLPAAEGFRPARSTQGIVPSESISLSALGSAEQPESELYASLKPTVRRTADAAHQAVSPDQLVLPLMHEGALMGLLVTVRDDRPWNTHERTQLEGVARTLAIARLLDQRGQWFDHQLHQKQLLQAQQHDTFHDLLHQFRNPLTALRTFGKLLLRRLQPEDPNRGVAEGIVRESDRLQDLLEQFRETVDLGEAEWVPNQGSAALPMAADQPSGDAELSQIHLGGAPTGFPSPGTPLLSGIAPLGASLELQPCQVAAVLEPLLISARAIAQEKQLLLQTEIPPALPPVRADVKALREVLSNLIDNALKYSPSGAVLYVQAGLHRYAPIALPQATVQGEASLETQPYQGVMVADTGPGIPAGDLAHIFERHYRGVQAQTDIPGTGLGLAIAKELIDRMQGQIQVLSPAVQSGLITNGDASLRGRAGPGTAFIVWLPEIRNAVALSPA